MGRAQLAASDPSELDSDAAPATSWPKTCSCIVMALVLLCGLRRQPPWDPSPRSQDAVEAPAVVGRVSLALQRRYFSSGDVKSVRCAAGKGGGSPRAH